MTRFLATGDQHLGKSQHLYPERLAEQEANWADTLELARERDVAAVLHAGDLFDSRRPSPEVLLAAERPLVEHRRKFGAPVIVIPGNHDIPTSDGECGLDVLAEASLIDLYRRPDVIETTIPGGPSIAVLPWTPIARLVASMNGVDRDRIYLEAAALLVDTAADLRRRTDGPMILLGHWSATGSQLPTGLPVDQLREVVLPVGELDQVGFDRIVLGHIHLWQEFGDRALYVGSPMALDHGEGSAIHGCWILDEPNPPEFVELPGRGFATLSLHPEDLNDHPVTDRVVRVRDTISAGNTVDTDAIRRALLDRGAFRVTFDLTWERAERPDREPAVNTDLDPVELLRGYLNGHDDTDRLIELARTYLAGERVLA